MPIAMVVGAVVMMVVGAIVRVIVIVTVVVRMVSIIVGMIPVIYADRMTMSVRAARPSRATSIGDGCYG